MTAVRAIRLIAKRELVTRKRAFLISTGLILFIFIAGIVALELSGVTEGATFPEEKGDRILAMFGTIVLFGTIIGYGQMALIGVVEEKSSRVVEVILGSVEPSKLLAGKIVGIGVFALAQTGAILGTTGGLLFALDTLPLPPGTAANLLNIFGFFMLGFAFYSTVYAAFGALLARTESASNAAGPLNLIVAVGYFTAIITTQAGDNFFARVLSLLPPFTPIVMPMRIVNGYAPIWEVALAVFLVLGAIYWVNRLAARIYIGGVMRGGAKSGLREAWRTAGL